MRVIVWYFDYKLLNELQEERSCDQLDQMSFQLTRFMPFLASHIYGEKNTCAGGEVYPPWTSLVIIFSNDREGLPSYRFR